jgi:hypothetical protein
VRRVGRRRPPVRSTATSTAWGTRLMAATPRGLALWDDDAHVGSYELAAQARRYAMIGVGGTVARGATTGAVRVSGAAWGAADATIMACRRMDCRR